jgi:hypothetical protein
MFPDSPNPALATCIPWELSGDRNNWAVRDNLRAPPIVSVNTRFKSITETQGIHAISERN